MWHLDSRWLYFALTFYSKISSSCKSYDCRWKWEGAKNLCVGNPGLEEAMFLQQRCGQKPPQGKGRTCEHREVTEMTGGRRTSGPLSDQGLNTEDETTPRGWTWYVTHWQPFHIHAMIYNCIYQYINNLLHTYFLYFRMVIQHTQHMNTSYPRKFSTYHFICILYFNMYCEWHIWNLILYNRTLAWLSL